MLNRIFILTYGRSNKQITWNNLPDVWKQKTFLVVQDREKHLYDSYPIVVLPEHIQTLAPTREWIVKQNLDKRFAVLDDDLSFYRTRMEDEAGDYSKRKMEESDFIEWEKTVCEWMDNDITFSGMDVAWNIPDRENLYKEITRLCANVYYDGTKFPANDLDWLGCEFSEDFHVTLQLLKKGYKNRVSNKFRIDTIATQSEGGCESERTLERHNSAMKKLAEFHPGIVKLYEKEVTGGQWKGIPRLAAKIGWKEAYKTGQVNSLDSFF